MHSLTIRERCRSGSAVRLERLIEVGKRIRDIYAQASANAERIFSLADDVMRSKNWRVQ